MRVNNRFVNMTDKNTTFQMGICRKPFNYAVSHDYEEYKY